MVDPWTWHTDIYMHRYCIYLREGSALSPDGTIMANDGRGGEVVASAINVTHQMVINVSLPRHCCLCFFFLVSDESCSGDCVWFWWGLKYMFLNKGCEGWCTLYRPFTSIQMLPHFHLPLHFRTQLFLFSYSYSWNRLETVSSSTELHKI